MLNLLNKSVIDEEKRQLIASITQPIKEYESLNSIKYDKMKLADYSALDSIESLEKICPQCHTKFPISENFCPECSLRLVDVNSINIEEIEIPHEISTENVELSEIFTKKNIDKLSEFNFTKENLDQITDNIKASSIKTLDKKP